MAAMRPKSLPLIIEHVFFLPKLPQTAEDNEVMRDAERDLINLLKPQVQAYCQQYNQSTPEINSAWLIIERMLGYSTLMAATSSLSADQVVAAFKDFEASGKFHIATFGISAEMRLIRRLTRTPKGPKRCSHPTHNR